MLTEHETLPTRWTLVARVKNPEDQASWKEFYEVYDGLVLGVARRAGLTESEAEDALQETMAAVAKRLKGFEANPARGSFRPWLLKIAKSKIEDQRRRRLPVSGANANPDSTATTPAIERVPDAGSLDWTGLCEAEWKERLLKEALKQLPLEVKAEHYQIFHLLTAEEKSVAEVARMVGRSQAYIYLTKHRVAQALKRIVPRVEKELEQASPKFEVRSPK